MERSTIRWRRELSDGGEHYQMEGRAIRWRGGERSNQIERGLSKVELAAFLSAIPGRRLSGTSPTAPSRRLTQMPAVVVQLA